MRSGGEGSARRRLRGGQVQEEAPKGNGRVVAKAYSAQACIGMLGSELGTNG
jgi:hypothetical protein